MNPTHDTPAAVRALEWGLRVPDEAAVAWGARAIYSLTHQTNCAKMASGKIRRTQKWVAEVDLLPDRQDARGSEAERKSLAKWINKLGLRELRKKLVADHVRNDADDILTIRSGDYQLIASPRGSYGYLYISAWKTP